MRPSPERRGPERSWDRPLNARREGQAGRCSCHWPWASTWPRVGPLHRQGGRRVGRYLRDPRSELERRCGRPGHYRGDFVRAQAGRSSSSTRPICNSYRKLMKKAQAAGIYVVLVDNPANFAADAFVGSDWDRRASSRPKRRSRDAVRARRKKIGLVQGDQANSSSLYQYAGIMRVLTSIRTSRSWPSRIPTGTRQPRATSRRPCCSSIPTSAASSTSGTVMLPARPPPSAMPASRTRSSRNHGRRREDGRLRQLRGGTFGAVVMTELRASRAT